MEQFKKRKLPEIIAGAGGKKSSGSSRTPVEADDTVNSNVKVSILDLLGEGVIGGLKDGAKSIFLNDLPLQNSDDTYNHSGVTWWFRDGSQDQSIIEGFDYTETPKTIGLQVKKTSAVTMAVDSDSADRFRVILKFPSLKSVDKKTGDTSGTSVTYKFQVSSAGGAFVDVAPEGESSGTVTLTAKKAGVYYRSYMLNLPKPGSKYQVRVVRVTDDNKDTTYLANDIYVDTVGEIINTNMNYPNSALVGLRVNSEQFGSSMPSRSYLISGMKIRVPSNYDEVANEYQGTWDGSFKLLSSSNPAWILYDLVTNKRYGLGEFVRESMFDLGQLYQIGRYCDALVDDGFGGKEKRFAINTQITTLQDAYRCVQDIAGAFRGMVYWAGGMVHVTQDSPSDPIAIYSNSNVIDGRFSYKGSARKDRPSVALITYNNKEDNYKQNIEYVEDLEAIKRYGIRKTESVAFGCTSRGMAHRVGLWTLYTGRMESDVITFQTGMDSAFLVPGDVILIHDKFRAGRRNSGRVVASTANSITLDATVDMTKAGTITFINAEGRMISRDILESGVVSKVTFKDAVNEADRPVADGVWVISQSDLKPLQARVVGVTQGEDGVGGTITCIQNNPSKYAAIDDGAVLIPQNTTVLDPTFSKPENLKITEGTYLSSPGNLNVSLTATWEGKSAEYWVSWRRSDAGNVSNWQTAKVNEEQFEVKPVAESGKYDFQVYGVSVSGRKTEILSATYQVLGTMTPPGAPSSLTAVGDYRQIILGWSNPSSVDLDHIQIYASKTNDVTKATLLAKSTTTNFTHSGLEDSVTWYYWIRSANKRGMTSDWSSKLGTSAMTRDVLSFLQNKITNSELAKDLLADIDSKAVAAEVDASIEDAKSEATAQVEAAKKEASGALDAAKTTLSDAIKQEATDRAKAVADEAKMRAQAVASEVDARTKAISDEAIARADAITKESDTRTKAMADEVTARNKAVADEAAARATAISDSVAVEATARAKAIADSASSLSDKIEKEVTDRVKAVSDLDTKTANAISSESSSRIAAISDEAKTRADAILQEKNSRQAEIKNVSAQMQTANESLAQQISQVAAGTGEQFDSLKIWYFDTNNEGWTEDDGSSVPMNVTSDGWLKSANSTSSCRSPNNMAIDANAYRFIKLRIKKVGNPVWAGKLYWIGASEQGWSDSRSISFDEPEYDANGIATLSLHDIDWRSSTTIRRLRLDFLKGQNDANYLLIDWIAVGRPTPGAGMAALQDEKTARTNADAAEAASRSTLATQLRGSYDGTDITKLSSGLIFQEQQARVTADKVEATARQSLETKVNDSVSSINKSLDTLNTKDQAMASDITGLKSSLGDKADASAVQTLKATVEQQGSNISTQGQSITKLQGDLNTTNTNVGKKADQTAMTALQGTVTQQGKDIAAANSSISTLKSSLDTTNDAVAKKADATAVSDLSSRVSATEGSVSSQGDSIVQLNNSLSNALADSDASAKTPNNLIVNPSFERGMDGYIGVSSLSTVVAIQIPHVGTKALKIDPGSSVSPGQYIDFVKGRTYEIGVWVKQVSGTTDNGQGNNKLRVGNSAGAPVFEVPFANLTVDWTKVSKRWKATETGSLPVTLSNYLTAGNRYFDDFYVIDVTDTVNIDASASAISSLQSTVTQQGKDISSQSTSIAGLNNSLNTTNENVAKKADSSAVQTLQNTVTQQGKDISTNANNITTLNGNLATTNAAVATKADASALSNLTTRVTQNEKNISSQSDVVTKLSNTVSNIAVGSANLIPNSGTMEGWSDVISDTYRGNKVFSFTRKANSSSYVQSNEIVLAGPVDSDSYVYSFWAKAAKDGTVINAYFYNPSNTTGSETSQGVKGSAPDGSAAITLTTSWARYWVKWTHSPTTGTKRFIPARLNNSSTADQTVFISSPQLETGNVVTDWKAADSDFASASALSTLTSRVTSDEGVISSQGSAITDLKNSLATTNSTVATKADASALSSLQDTVTKQGTDLKSASDSITTLKNSIAATDANVAKKADASALQTLQSTVSTQGDKIASQGNSITSLGNSLDTVKGDVAKKADATALDNLSTRVSNAEGKISSSSDAITSLNSSLNQQSKRGANILPDGTFESYSSGYNITNGRVIVTADDSHGGNKCIRVTRPNDYTNYTDNSDNHIFSGFQVRDNAVFYVECWVKLDAKSTTMDGSVQIAVGMSLQYQDNSWQWPALIKSAKDLSADTWTKVSGYLKSSKSGIKQAMVRISIPNVSTVKAGNSFLVDDFVITDVTDAYNAQQTADATASAVSTLQTTVSRQGDSITSQGDSITTLNNGLATANKAIGTKADASALSSLQNTVTQQGEDVAANTNNITALSNQVVNGKQATWARRIYKCQLASAGTEPTFSDIQGLSPVFMDEVADAAKMDFSGAGSYVVAHYKAMVRVAADTTITMAPGSRVFDDTGAVYVNGVRVAFGNAGWNTVSFDLKAGWNTVEFLINQWTGNAYVNLGFKLGDKVAELYSGLGVSSLSSALNSITSNVSKVGDQVSSNSTAITSLKNGLSDTNSTVAKKADATALQTLQNTVTQQGKDIASQSDSVTNLSNALNNVSIGGVNLVKNSGDMTGWSGKTNEVFRGNAVISATSKAGSSYRDLKEIILDAPVDNAEYVYSFFAKGGENGQSMTAYFYNPNSTISSVSSQGVSGGDVDGRMSFTLTTEWVRYWVKWKQKPGTGSKKLILARIQASSTKDQTVSITSPKLEVGNMPTEWSPAPSDMASSNDLSSLKTTVDANSGAIQSVTSRVQKTEDNISTQNTAITKLQGDLSSTNNLVSTKADSTALQTLSGRVDKTESSISTQNDAITKLNSSLDTTNKAVAKKAEQSSLDTLSGRVSSTENGITAANSSITSLNAAIRAENASSGDLITNPTFDPQYAQMGFTVVSADTDGVPANCPFRYAAKLAARDHHPNFNTIVATLGDVFEISALVACGAGNADFNLYLGTANGPTGGIGAPLYNGGNTKATSTWTRVTWKFTVSQAMVDKGYIRPFLQINQSSPFGTIWYVTDWHMRNITAASKAQDTANATSKAVDSLTSTVNQQGSDISSIGSRTTSLENGLSTTNANVAKKADSSALQTLQNSVTQQGNDISGQGSRVTSLENNLTAGANLIPNPAMLNGAQGWDGSATTVDGYAAVVSSSGWAPSSSYFQVTPGDIIDLSLMSQSAGAASISWGLRFDGPGLSNFCLYAPALTFAAGEKKSVSAAITVPAGATKAMFQASARATSARTVYNIIATRRDAGTKANSSAIDTLNSTVKTQGDTLSSIGSRTTSLENGLNSANNALSLKADASALSSLTNTVTQQGKDLDAAEANITAANTSITSMQASLTRRTVFTITSRGVGSSAKDGIFDESGVKVFAPGRSYALVTFKANSDGSTSIDTSKTYDVFGSANNGKTMSDDIAALANGVYACVMTFDEPSGSRSSIYAAVELLGGTSEVLASLPYRGAYILLGRKGMKAGDGLELRAPTGGDQSAFVSTSVEFVNGVMMGLGAAGGVMMKADANASAITTLQNTVTQQGKDITSSSSAITSLQNGLVAANSNIDKKADATALQSLQNTVTQQGKDISTQSGNVTNLQNSLSATNTGLANLVADSDASKKIIGNLLTNSSFERGLEGFSGGASFIKVIDAQSPNSGSKILSCGAGSGSVSQSIAVTKDRTYKIGAFARCQSGSVVDNQSNNKLRIGNSSLLADFMFKPTDLPTDSTWKEISGTWKATVSGSVDVSINSSLKSGNQYFDDFYFIDITDIVNIDATSNAVASLTSRVTSAEGTVSSHTGSITNLSNSLNSLNNTVSGKADASALQSLQNTVTQQGKDLSSASGSITSLQSSLNTIKVQSNPWIDGTFETYDNNQQLGGSTAIVTTDFKNSGSKCLKVTRPANTSGNSDKMIGPYSAVRQSAKYRVEFWAMMPASEAPPSGWTVVVGLHSINKDGGNDWQGIAFDEAGLGGRDQWVKFTGVVKVSPSVTRSHVWISTRGQSGSNTPGYAVYIDDVVITDITDAADAQATADANATAISSLQTKVSDIDGKVTAQTSQLSSMQSKVDSSSSKVDQMSKTLSDSQSTQASLNTSLQSQIDAQASANIKNQADLNSAATSIATIKSTQSTQATQLSAIAKQQTDMTASLDNQSASIQTLQESVANNDSLKSTWMVKMETNSAGQKYAAGIALGVDGKSQQSQFLVQADRFALINTSNGNTTTPFVIDNGVTYMNAAYIKDGAITNAKIGGEIRSDNFVDGSQGWRVGKDGSSQFHNVVVRGHVEANSGSFRGAVYATDGWFQGTVYANRIEGDIGSFAINIAQHRTRKVPKATWQWFELARFRRQSFDQVINIRGGLLQTDSITIDGGSKLRAGMSYAPGADGGLNPGYLSYAMLLRGTGATSGGGSMEIGIELMYETGGWNRLLTAQGEMNVDNMSFVVPAGSGDAVLRYGCYLDRNGQMVLTILSRFDAFSARNNNVIRGSSTP
ncbi:phage tail tip fiber protein [Klebsiella pneumoniae]|uniref:phage tail tip fiber protein n=1 Tax=Klebsiella pneumoniae TaxID=573 RepID=UPI000DE7B7EA|nr:phage tail protein [Klebsiella pneumoniae]SSK05533.1 putative phage tail protein [Klebsiella pneumoniae]